MDGINALKNRFLALGFQIPELLLPRDSVDLSAWAVIACDQFTQDPAYWEGVREAAAGGVSALNLIFPECYLSAASGPAGGPEGNFPPEEKLRRAEDLRRNRISAVHRAMNSYLAGDVFGPPFTGGVYLERDTPCHKGRRGLILALDLDCYDWGAGARTLIRATEGTAPERLPPRMDIRRYAPLETSHVLLLIDDEGNTLLPGLAERLDSAPPAYRGNLMLGAGSVTGWRVDREEHWAFIADQMEALRRRAENRYPGASPDPFLCAVGDGNHSLAAAKAVWEEYKRTHAGEPGLMKHPARFALAEIENLYDPAISFEPIHRVIFNAAPEALLAALAALPDFSLSPLEGPGALEKLCRLVEDRTAPRTRLGLVAGPRLALLETSAPGLATVALQPVLDRFAGGVSGGASGGASGGVSGGVSIDYIHGAEELIRLARPPGERIPGERTPGEKAPGEGASGERTPGGAAAQAPAVNGTTGILLPPIRKEGLFETVARSGPLPRKSFSMGEAVEKRFYLECRRLY